MEQAKNKLFRILQQGDANITYAHEEAIVLVGLTRAGKSTGFNWILKLPMVGKGGRNSYYVNVVNEDPTIAQVADSFSSVTLAPNVFVDFTNETSLIDMAGYQDSRDYIGVIGVSYFLKALFEKVRKVKFVIVFSEQRFTEETGAGIITTFNGFFNMFKFNLMTEDIINKLIQSVGILVTRSKEGEYHFEYMRELIQKLKDKSIVVENRELIIQFLDKLCLQARTEEFKKAKENENPEECKFIERWNRDLKWEYFNLNQIEAEIEQSVIAVPFERDFGKLPQEQKQMFKAAVDARVHSYVQFKDVLNTFLNTFKDNWTEFNLKWRNQGKIEHNYFQMKPMFEKLNEFLKENDCYNSQKLVHTEFRVSYEPQTLVKAIENNLKIYQIVEFIGTQGDITEEFPVIMDIFSKKFTQLADCLKTFASSEDQQKNIERLKFILQRGFRQFKKLYELHPQNIHQIKQILPDHLNTIFEEDKQVFCERFTNALDSELLPKALPKLELLIEYAEFFEKFENEFRQRKQAIYFSKVKSNIEIAKADILFFNGEKTKALHCYINSLLVQGEIRKYIQDGVLPEEEKQIELDKIYKGEIKLIRKIAGILKNLSQECNFNPKLAALKLCQNYNMIHQVCEIYQIILKSPNIAPTEKKERYDDYADFLVKWGKIDLAIELLYKKVALTDMTMPEEKLTMEKVANYSGDYDNLRKYHKERCLEWKRLPTDPELEIQLEQIRNNVPI